METVQKTENNNQNVNIQNLPSTSRADCNKNTYLCVPHGHPFESAKAKSHHQKFKHAGDGDNNHISFRTLSEMCASSIWYGNKAGHSSEEPMDLTCSDKRIIKGRTINGIREIPAPCNNFDFEKNSQLNLSAFSKVPNTISSVKRRGRKRKYEIKTERLPEEHLVPNSETCILKTLDNPNYFQIADNKQAEVIRAAKSLFSKRTRTLYHWMYPNAPKAQLKAAVASSWETLGVQEKEFYISQVLGRFGFPQTNLMVNPQLGGIAGALPLPLLDLTTANQVGSEETSTAVSTLLMSENRNSGDGPWTSSQSTPGHPFHCPPFQQRLHRKRGRLGRPPGSKNRRQVKEEIALLKQIREDPAQDEFQDDPELSREFQQFKWTLHLNDNEKD